MKILNLSQSQRATFKQRPQITHKQASYETQDNMQLSTGNALESIGRAKVMFQGNTQIANQENPNDLGDGITIKLTPNPNQPNLCTCEILGIPEFIEKYKQGKIPNAFASVAVTVSLYPLPSKIAFFKYLLLPLLTITSKLRANKL